ncbi:hypothetical protein TNCV_3578201 [Trichonephila clavipes]|nr:hypothetical protein TNCV_3578201 [Trichonephila clavipes]
MEQYDIFEYITTLRSLDDSLRCRTVGRLEAGQSQLEAARRLQTARKWTTAPQLIRDLAAVSERRISRQILYSRLTEIGLYVRLPVLCVPLTASIRESES